MQNKILIKSTILIFCLITGFKVTGEERSRFIYDDINRFQVAYNEYVKSQNADVFEDYLNNGTLGLQEFRSQFALTPKVLKKSIDVHPKFYQSLKDLKERMIAQEDAVNEAFDSLQQLFPNHQMPQVYYVVGGLRAGGQGGEGNYVLIGAETYARHKSTDMTEFSQKARLFDAKTVSNIVAHEAAHIIQEDLQGREQYLSIYTQPGKGTLLAYALREGAAEFIAKLVSGSHINPQAEEYGLQQELALWENFKESRAETDLGDWFFYRPRQHPEWPIDLGYWLGYRISSAYYDSRSNKHKAVRDILGVTDYENFLQQSGYQGGQRKSH